MEERMRCDWARGSELERDYHDTEWGKPEHDDHVLFEFLILEGMQAGLSWVGILRKRENFRRALDGFDVRKIAQYGPEKIEALMQDEGIIRNRRKLECTVSNAQAFIRVQEEFGSFDAYIWAFVDGQPIVNEWTEQSQMPSETELSRAVSKDLRARGFKFVGPVIVYSYLQAIGIINDHMKWCAFFSK